MKRLIVMGCVGLMILVFIIGCATACGKKEEPKTETAPEEAPVTTDTEEVMDTTVTAEDTTEVIDTTAAEEGQ
ncbi:MAG: hypothetical protein JSV44_00395 [Candidatus Zixiibacteriota bacterium]|nr:MAG: hypothetical protein JSV44_00395 [candidate division Zixibacteria bacterium]